MPVKIFATLFCMLLLMAIGSIAQTSPPPPPLENGVSQKLAVWRTAHYSNVRYKLNIVLEKGASLMTGEVEIKVDLIDDAAKNDLVLDWRTTQFAADKDKPYAYVMAVNENKEPPVVELNEHLKIPYNFLKAGENTIRIKFASPIKTSGSAITRYVDKEDGGEYVYSLFVPSDASTAFPCFDQPDLKARFRLTLSTPYGWNSVSNTDGKTTDLDKADKSAVAFPSQVLNEFAETQPISTYVFAFAAGNFTVIDEAKNSEEITRFRTPRMKEKRSFPHDSDPKYSPNVISISQENEGVQIFVRRSQAEKFKQHAAEVFRLNREGVKFLEEYFDYKFPFPKYDLVLIPEFPFGGMEHAGATFLREASVIFPQEPTANDYISRANVIFHEAAHQWFGDTVTMRWFDDLWLKEGFAEFMAYKTLEKTMPQYNAWKAFYERNKQSAYLTDSTQGTTSIYQPIENLSAAKSAYGNIVYKKAPSFLRQAEFYLGPDKFQTAVRAFLQKHQFANAGWEDLVKEFENVSKKNLGVWARGWVKQRGMPRMNLEITKYSRVADATHLAPPRINLIFSQSPVLGGENLWIQKMQFLYLYEDGHTRVQEVSFNENDKEIEELWGIDFKGNDSPKSKKDLLPPKFVFTNYQDYGYGTFLLDEKSRDYALKNIHNEKDVFLRAMMWGSLWDSVREQELNPREYVELVVKNLASESDETTIGVLLGHVSTAMNYYLPEKARVELAPKLEDLLVEKMLDSPTMGQKLTFYRAFLNVASTEKARGILKQILRREFTEQGPRTAHNAVLRTEDGVSISDKTLSITPANAFIPLKTKDKFDIVTRLMILGDIGAPSLLAALEKTETSDEAKRYAYAARAGTASAENKAKYFDDFINNRTISESWIEAAFNPFNSVRHSETTLPYLEKALAELPNLKRNRKIFFINGWLGAFIGGQRSERALAIVNKFLTDNPKLDNDLKLKIRENVDLIERAVKIRAKYGN